jgi:hypothetical protein
LNRLLTVEASPLSPFGNGARHRLNRLVTVRAHRLSPIEPFADGARAGRHRLNRLVTVRAPPIEPFADGARAPFITV